MKTIKVLNQTYRNHLTNEIKKIANPRGDYTEKQKTRLYKLHELRREYDMQVVDLLKNPKQLKNFLKETSTIRV